MESNYSINSKVLLATIIMENQDSFSFQVEDVEICKEAPVLATPEVIFKDHINIKNKIEDFSHRENDERSFIVGRFPGLLLALHTAYESHYPLKLSVSDFIILIGQGLGRHIDRYSEELRHHFVNHSGKEEIIVRRDGFVLGKQNDWSTTFDDFAEEIKKRVNSDIYDIVVDDTSVATIDSRIVSEITLMDCMKNYFDYTLSTRCGIPQITLEGTPDDWKKLREKFRKLVETNKDDCLKLDFWLKHLAPVLEEVCETGINRKANINFWTSIYKYTGNKGSGTPHMSGWITVFFPYLAESKVNNFSYPAMLYTSFVPKQMCEVPFIWDYLGTKIPMTFYGGFMGAHFDEDSCTVSPAHFWCVAYKDEITKEDEEEFE